jgi:hypothetical protein
MRRRLVKLLSTLVLGYLGVPAWAQAPLGTQPLPEPTPLGNPTESPPLPGEVVSPNIIVTPSVVTGLADNCACNKHGYWTVGGGVYYIQPVFETNPAFLSTTGVAGTTFLRQNDFSNTFDVAPLGFLSYTDASGWGLRGRWFSLESEGHSSAALDGGSFVSDPAGFLGASTPGSVLDANNHLRLNVGDVEATYIFNCGSWSLLSSAGARYAYMSQDYNLNIVEGGIATSNVSAGHNFSGAGPTFSLEGRRQVWNPCWTAYGSMRASILFGTGRQHATAGGTAVAGGPFDVVSHQTDVLPIGEIEIGGEYAKVWGRYRLFAQLGFVGQVWLGGGNASQGLPTSFTNLNDNGTNFGLLGGVFRAGINF